MAFLPLLPLPPSSSARLTEWKQYLAKMEEVFASDPMSIEARSALLEARMMVRRQTPQLFVCPSCKQKRGVTILYGYPTEEALKQAERNEAVLGGCMQEIGAPDRQCLSCGHQWEIVRRGARVEGAN